MSTPNLTPYDTGARCEPRVWPTPTYLALENFSPEARAIEEDRFGRVDFDDDTAATVCTVHVVRGEDGQHVVVIDNHRLDGEVVVSLRQRKTSVVADNNGAQTFVNAPAD